MLSPTIREDLGRIRQLELARAAERRGRLATTPRATPAWRAASAVLALLHRRSTPSTSARPRDTRVPGDEPFVSLRLVGSDRHPR